MLYFNLFRRAPGARVLYKGPATQCHLGPAYRPILREPAQCIYSRYRPNLGPGLRREMHTDTLTPVRMLRSSLETFQL
jgi:hypothetical protein